MAKVTGIKANWTADVNLDVAPARFQFLFLGKALLDGDIEEVTVRLCRKTTGEIILKLPESEKKVDGKTQYYPEMKISKELQSDLLHATKKAFLSELAKNRQAKKIEENPEAAVRAPHTPIADQIAALKAQKAAEKELEERGYVHPNAPIGRKSGMVALRPAAKAA